MSKDSCEAAVSAEGAALRIARAELQLTLKIFSEFYIRITNGIRDAIHSEQCKHTKKVAVFADEANIIFKDSKEFSGSFFISLTILMCI